MILYQEDLWDKIFKSINEMNDSSKILQSVVFGSKGKEITALDIDFFVSYYRLMVETLNSIQLYNSSFKDDKRLVEQEKRLNDLVSHTQSSITSLIVKSNSYQ